MVADAIINEERNRLVGQLQTMKLGPSEDPLLLVTDLLTKAKTAWMRVTYPFAGFGRRVSIHYSCEIRRPVSSRIRIGDRVYIAPGTWLNVPECAADAPPAIILESGCRIG